MDRPSEVSVAQAAPTGTDDDELIRRVVIRLIAGDQRLTYETILGAIQSEVPGD